jgi:cell division protein FtsL
MKITPLFETLNIDLSIIFLILAVIVSAMAVIYSKHVGRDEFVILQQLEKQRDQLNDEWGRLLLEQSTWANPVRIEQQASTRLQMIVPSAEMTVVVDHGEK